VSTSSPIVPDALVGRGGDCGALDELVEAVRQGRSRSLVIVGEPGIGKTRLLRYAAQAADGVRTVSIAGVESELRLGFAALHRMLVPFLDRISLLPAPQRDALGSAFGLAAGPPADRFLVSLSVLTLLADAAAEQPLIWLVDDAQWLDRESLEVLGFVGRRLYADSIGLLFGAREAAPGLAALDGLPTRHLRGLEPAAARALLATNISGSLNARVAARIIAETGGNPLALQELARQLTPGQLAGRAPLPPRLPAGRHLHGHFLRQVKMLPPAAGSFLLLASAASSDDPAALWRAAALLGLGPDAADPAVARDIVSVDPRLAFRHPLIRSAVYEGARSADRRRVHDALATIASQDGYPDQAAWHRAAATVVPDEDVAADLERSADRATTEQWGHERGAAVLGFFALIGLTVLELSLGCYVEALTWAMRIYDDDPPGFGNRILPEIVEAGTRGGDIGAARAALSRLADRAAASGTPWALGVLARSRALLAPDADAEAFYRAAIAHLTQTSVRTELARAHLLYGEWLRRQKRRKDARSQLRTARDMFDAMGAAAFARRARAELLAVGDSSHQPAEQPGPDLTPQEAQVSRLAAAGATNAEIATHMFVTTSTVEYHLSKVFRKLNITSRRQLATVLTS
jgi:DNA-binding CsgD family transcriptional regulator